MILAAPRLRAKYTGAEQGVLLRETIVLKEFLSTDGRNVLWRKIEFPEGTLKTRRIFRISFMWPWRFTQVVTQSRRRRALQRMGEDRFRAILLQAWRGVEPVEFSVGEGKDHPVGASSGGWKKRGALADP